MRSGTSSPRFLILALLAGLALVPAPLLAADVIHRLSFPELRQQYVEVEAEFPAEAASVELIMPSWAPGAYVIRDFASDVDHFEVRDAQGRALDVVKTAKDAWTVTTQGADRLIVSYRVHAAELNPAASWASTDFIMLNGPSVFLYTESSRDLPQRVEVSVPDGLGTAMSSMAAENGGWMVRDYDELVDNPIVIADADVTSFSVDGHEYYLVHVGDASLWDTEQAAADLRSIVQTINAFWGSVPLDRPYWFFNLLVEKGGGLEHDHGTVMTTSRWQMRDRQDYIQWLSLATHEYFHAWNVRRLRPEGLERYDYRREQYSPALWLAEGLTSYYDDLLPSRAGVVEPAEYLDRLAHQFHSMELTPGRQKLSLREASRDAWIRHYQPDANVINTTISYYVKGAVLGFVLDTRLRRESREKVSLDDILVSLYASVDGGTYAEADFVGAVRDAAGDEVADWLARLLDSTVDPDIDEALDFYGLGLDRRPNGQPDDEGPGRGGLGINWEKDTPDLVVAAVVDGYAAARAGVLPGDEVLGLNGERVTRDNVERIKARLREGERVELLLARQGKLKTLVVQLSAQRPTYYEVGIKDGFGRRELRRLERWLGQELAMPD